MWHCKEYACFFGLNKDEGIIVLLPENVVSKTRLNILFHRDTVPWPCQNFVEDDVYNPVPCVGFVLISRLVIYGKLLKLVEQVAAQCYAGRMGRHYCSVLSHSFSSGDD